MTKETPPAETPQEPARKEPAGKAPARKAAPKEAPAPKVDETFTDKDGSTVTKKVNGLVIRTY